MLIYPSTKFHHSTGQSANNISSPFAEPQKIILKGGTRKMQKIKGLFPAKKSLQLLLYTTSKKKIFPSFWKREQRKKYLYKLTCITSLIFFYFHLYSLPIQSMIMCIFPVLLPLTHSLHKTLLCTIIIFVAFEILNNAKLLSFAFPPHHYCLPIYECLFLTFIWSSTWQNVEFCISFKQRDGSSVTSMAKGTILQNARMKIKKTKGWKNVLNGRSSNSSNV